MSDKNENRSMKFEIEIESLWLEDESLSEGLTNKIRTKVVNRIYQKIEKTIKKEIEEVADKLVRDSYSDFIDEKLRKYLSENKVQWSHRSEDVKTVDEFVEDRLGSLSKFQANKNLQDSLSKKITQIANDHWAKIEERYDLMFATQLISKMKENGMLNENISKVLFEGKKPEPE